MTREDVIRLAREVGAFTDIKNLHVSSGDGIVFVPEELERFYDAAFKAGAEAERERLADAAMKAAEKAIDVAIALEREACAAECDKIEKRKWETVVNGGLMQGIGARDCAAAIRARGEK